MFEDLFSGRPTRKAATSAPPQPPGQPRRARRAPASRSTEQLLAEGFALAGASLLAATEADAALPETMRDPMSPEEANAFFAALMEMPAARPSGSGPVRAPRRSAWWARFFRGRHVDTKEDVTDASLPSAKDAAPAGNAAAIPPVRTVPAYDTGPASPFSASARFIGSQSAGVRVANPLGGLSSAPGLVARPMAPSIIAALQLADTLPMPRAAAMAGVDLRGGDMPFAAAPSLDAITDAAPASARHMAEGAATPMGRPDATGDQASQTSSNSPTTNAVAAGSAPLPVFGGQQDWKGGTDDWNDNANWTSVTKGVASGYPLPGQTAVVGSGTAILNGSEGKVGGTFDSVNVSLGSSSGATLMLNSAVLGATFNVTTAGTASILASGTSVFQGSLFATSNTSLTLGSVNGGNLIINLNNNASNGVNNDALIFVGTTTVEETSTSLFTSGAVSVGGTINLIGGRTSFNGAVTGSGTVNVGLGGVARFGFNSGAGSVASGLIVHFSDVDGAIELGSPTSFNGTITNFHAGDSIDFSKITGSTAATFDTNAHQLILKNGSSTLATLNNVYGNAGSLSVATSSDGGTRVSFAGATSAVDQGAAASAVALGATTVQSTLTAPGTGKPITGDGIKIGVISDSFNLKKGADAAAAAGFLPQSNGASAVTVVKEGATNGGGEDEGQAMCEAIYQDAPGAQLYFASATSTETGFADSVQQLRDAGCQVIVDDYGYSADANNQIIGPVATAAQNAVAGGVNYFTSAGNYGHSAISMPFAPQAVTLPDGSAANAVIFSNGTPYEPVTMTSAGYAFLRWAAPFAPTDGSNAPNELTFKVFDTSGTLKYTSKQDTAFDSTTQKDALSYAYLATGNYFVSVYNNSGTPVPASFSFSLINNGTEEVIDDPLAGNNLAGTEAAQEIVPGVNSVGAIYYGQSQAYGVATATSETFSSIGGGQLLFDKSGNALATPQSLNKVNFSAPDAQYSTIFGAFYGTSAAAPNAAAVAALMLQADGRLTNTQVSYLLAQTASPFGYDTAQSGAGLIQAVPATQGAITAATTPIWTAQDGSASWSDAANWSDSAVPGMGDTAQLTNGIGTLTDSYSVTYDLAGSTIAGLTLDGGTTGVTSAPALLIGSSYALTVTGAVAVTDNSSLTVTGTLQAGAITVGAGSTLSFASDSAVSDTSLTLNGGTLDEIYGFATPRALLIGSGGGTIKIDGGTAELAGALSGGSASTPVLLTKSGPGTLQLDADNSGFNGALIVAAGALAVSKDNNLGASSNALFLERGTLEETTGFTTGRSIGLVASSTIQIDSGTATLSGLVIDGDQNGNGGGDLTKSGNGTLVLANSGNSYTFGTTVTAGTLSIGADGALGNTHGRLTLGGIGAGSTGTGNPTLEITAPAAGAAAFSSARNVQLNGAATIQVDGGTATLSGILNGGPGNALTKTGAGTLLLSGRNSYGTTTVAAGEIDVGNRDALGSGAVALLDGTALGLRNVAIRNKISVSGDPDILVTGTGNSMPSYTGAAGTVTNILGTDSAASGDVLTLTGGGGSYAGATNIGFTPGGAAMAVTLKGGAANSLGATSQVTIGDGSVLDLGGYDQTIGTLASDSGGIISNGGNSGAVHTLTVGSGGSVSTVSGLVQDGASPTALAVNSGTLELGNGGNDYTGGTTIGTAGGSIPSMLLLDVAGAAGTGAITFTGGAATATLMLAAAAQPATGTTLMPGSLFANALANFDNNDELDLAGFTYSALDVSTVDGDTLTFNDTPSGRTERFALSGTHGTAYFVHDAGANGVVIDENPCYCTGTGIRSWRDGRETDVAVEALAIGDIVVTASGARRPIRWIGTRAYGGRFANANPKVLPIRIATGALANEVPRRDLWVSPEHALYLDGVLIPAERLVNGVTITRAERVDAVTYWHVELDSHDVLLAEGAPAESYLDDDNRAMFHNAHTFVDRDPGQRHRYRSEPAYCAPRLESGYAVRAVRRRLDARAGLPVPPLRGPGVLHGAVDGCVRDEAGGTRVWGWAQSSAYPEAPVCLEVVADGAVAALVYAQDHRADLAAAGIGAHAFDLRLPQSLPAGTALVVRRALDAAVLADAPDVAAISASA